MNRIDAIIADINHLRASYATEGTRANFYNEGRALEIAQHNHEQCQDAIKALKSIITETIEDEES